jgi:hypothetical protein
MAKTPRTGRPSIFRGKKGGTRVHGIVTPAGSIAFEQARKRLGKLVGHDVEDVSDGDVVEYLALGDTETRRLLDLD